MALESVTIKDASDLTETIATDEVGGLNYQVLKLAFGADGTATLVDSGTGLPVLIVGAIPAGANVIGKVDINNAIPAGANTIGSVAISAGNNNIGDVDLASAIPAGNNNIGDVDIASIAAGTNNIGDVDLASPIPAGSNIIGIVGLDSGSNLIGEVDLNSVPAASRTTDSTSSVLATDAIMNNLTPLTPKYAKANVATSTTDGAVITAVGGKKLRVLAFRLHCAATAQTVTFNSKPGGAGTAISEAFALGANGGRAEAFSPVGHFETVSGEGLTVTTAAGGSTTGIGIVYVEV